MSMRFSKVQSIASSLDSSLYSSVVEWDNLWLAWRKAAKGKRGGANVAAFELQVADHLLQLQDKLSDKSYRPGPYTHFYIHEPKQRKISAAPFRDRVALHALCNVIERIFDTRFIRDSYANRRGKGTHRAIDRLQHFARHYPYVLRMDIVKHFPSLDHAVLMDAIGQVIGDRDVLWLVEMILASGVGVLADEYDPGLLPWRRSLRPDPAPGLAHRQSDFPVLVECLYECVGLVCGDGAGLPGLSALRGRLCALCRRQSATLALERGDCHISGRAASNHSYRYPEKFCPCLAGVSRGQNLSGQL